MDSGKTAIPLIYYQGLRETCVKHLHTYLMQFTIPLPYQASKNMFYCLKFKGLSKENNLNDSKIMCPLFSQLIQTICFPELKLLDESNIMHYNLGIYYTTL